MDRLNLSFHIHAYSTDTMPMQRVAAYIGDLAVLLGEFDKVQPDRIDDGSAAPKFWAEDDASDAVRLEPATVSRNRA